MFLSQSVYKWLFSIIHWLIYGNVLKEISPRAGKCREPSIKNHTEELKPSSELGLFIWFKAKFSNEEIYILKKN